MFTFDQEIMHLFNVVSSHSKLGIYIILLHH